jgi:2-polyprenyl-3-methyl-5-hydroxy-6-metoxy-1,4-benzoquinol methylase
MSWRRRTFTTPEWMDAAEVPPRQLDAALRYIRTVNRRLGYTRATVAEIRRALNQSASRGASAAGPATVLDVATGSGDVPQAVRDAAGGAAWVIGLDLHASTLAHARAFTSGAIPLVRGDAVALPFADNSFDVVTASMFLHHLPDALVVAALAEMGRVARERVVVADLIRNRRALAWITLFTLGRPKLIRHDARVSVRQSFTLVEIERLAVAAGLRDVKVQRKVAHRFILTAAGG